MFAEYWTAIVSFFSFDPILLTDPSMMARLALLVLLLLGSAFFSGSETALFSLSRLDLQQLLKKHHPQAATLHALLNQPRRLIISILCGNELINIAAVTNMTSILVSLYGEQRAAIISILLMVPLLLLFGEITPKTIAISNPVRFSTGLVAVPMNIWIKLVTPLRWLVRGIADQVTNWIVGKEKAPENILHIDEFRSIVDEYVNVGKLGPTEHTLIYHLLDAGATEIVEIMTPRTRIDSIDADLAVPDIIQQFQNIRHSRVPLYQQHQDNIIGFLHIEKVLPLVLDKVNLEALSLQDILLPPIVVPPTKKVDEMFDFFQRNNARAALVLNEFGGVDGFVTLRDVLTFIFGHLSGEVAGQALYEEKDKNVYEVLGDMKLTDFNNLTNFGIEDPRMTTVAGVAFRHLDRLPCTGDQVTVEGVVIKVLEVKEQRIVRVLVSKGPIENHNIAEEFAEIKSENPSQQEPANSEQINPASKNDNIKED